MRSRHFTRDNGDLVEVDFSYRIFDGVAEVDEYTCWLVADANDANAPEFQLTDAEYERFDAMIQLDDSLFEYGDDY